MHTTVRLSEADFQIIFAIDTEMWHTQKKTERFTQ